MDIPSQFSPRALPGDAERCLAFRCVVKRISHEENQQVRQKFNRHRSRSPILDNDGRYASAGARERFLQYLALNHRADLAKAGFTGRQIGQMADLRPFDPRADNVIWQVHHKIPIQVSGLLKDPNDFKNLVFLPEHEHETPNAVRQTQPPHPAGGYSFVPHRFIRALFTAQRTIGWCAAIKK